MRHLSESEGGTSDSCHLLQPPEILVWKWDDISMDFTVGLPRKQKGNDSIWVIVDRLTKVAYFLAVKANYSVSRLAELYVDDILKLHGASRSIGQTEDRSLPHNSGRAYMLLWVPS
jgi:hypothetical protein